MYAATLRSNARRNASAPETARLQRSFGTLDIAFAAVNGVSRAVKTYQQGAVKLRLPNVARGCAPEGVFINLAGGMTGGDRQDIAVDLAPGAAAVLTSQACEKIYRSPGEDAQIACDIRLAAGSRLEWLPQPVILFDGARLKRETYVHLSADASLLAVEAAIFGRTARGEDMSYGALSDGWFVRRAGRLIHAERFAVCGAIRTQLDKPSVLGGNRAMATIRYFAADAESRLEEMRALFGESGTCAASAWNGMLLARFAAADGYSLTGMLMRVLGAFRGGAMPRVWSL